MIKLPYNITFAECQKYIGKKCVKESGKPFKSRNIIATIKGVTIHPIIEVAAFLFLEDDTYVEARQVIIIEDEPKAYNHRIDRNIFLWGSYGKFGDKPLRKTLVKDISDAHLCKVVEHIKINFDCYDAATLKLMEDEVTFRTKNYIFVPETYD